MTPTKPAEQFPVVSHSQIQITLDAFTSVAKEKKQQTREKTSPSKGVSKLKARLRHMQWLILCVTGVANTFYWLYFLYSWASVCEAELQLVKDILSFNEKLQT